ncbi:M50 family metallopeptidase [Nanoarchaeota archaeon]
MDKSAKLLRTPLRWLGYSGIVVGFFGMIAIAWMLIDNTFNIFFKPAAAPGVGIVLPIEAKGVFFVPFIYWILAIFIIAVIHEASHGIIARVHKIPLKSSGFAFLGILLPIIPAAFVEPNEKKLQKTSVSKQLSVFAAGPYSNIITGIIFGLIFVFLLVPMFPSVYDSVGIEITGLVDDAPAQIAGITEGEVIQEIDEYTITDTGSLVNALQSSEIGPLKVVTDKQEYSVQTTDKDGIPFLGISLKEKIVVKESFSNKYGTFTASIYRWLLEFFNWLTLLSIGIGLFNLVPVGPIDGGRMLKLVSEKYFKDIGHKAYVYISFFFLAAILVNVLAGFF